MRSGTQQSAFSSQHSAVSIQRNPLTVEQAAYRCDLAECSMLPSELFQEFYDLAFSPVAVVPIASGDE
jgi:hypothetical protein